MKNLHPQEILGDFSSLDYWNCMINSVKMNYFENFIDDFVNLKNHSIGQRQGYLSAIFMYETISEFDGVNYLLVPKLYQGSEKNLHFLIKAANLIAFSSYGLISFGQHCKIEDVDEYLRTSSNFFLKLITTHWTSSIAPEAIIQIVKISEKYRREIANFDKNTNNNELSEIFLLHPLAKNKNYYENSMDLLFKIYKFLENSNLSNFDSKNKNLFN